MVVPTFLQPLWLVLLLLVPLLVWWWGRQGRGAIRFSSTSLVAAWPGERGRRVRNLGKWLRGLVFGLLVLALAGPRWPDPGTRLPTYGIALVVVVDVSRSMNEPDFRWQNQAVTRLEAVKKTFRLFVEGGTAPDGQRLEGRPNDLIGLVVFATRPECVCPLTLDHPVLLKILEGEQPRLLPGEATTNVGDALALGLHRLQEAPSRRKVLVLLTDGEHNVPAPALTPRQAAQLAANLTIPIYTIQAGGDLLVSDKEDPQSAAETIKAREALQTIAAMTRGKFFQAGNATALLETCRHIDLLERQEILSWHYRRYHEGFVWFALGAFVLWVIVQILESTVWRVTP